MPLTRKILSTEQTAETSVFSPSARELLVQEMTVGGDVLDRELFYVLTEGKSKEQMEGLKAEVTKDVEAYYEGVARQNGISFEDYCRTHKFIYDKVDSWFSPLNLLQGKMDHELMGMVNAVDRGHIGKDSLKWAVVSIAIINRNEHPEFKREIVGLVGDFCKKQDVSLLELPASVKRKFPELFPRNVAKGLRR